VLAHARCCLGTLLYFPAVPARCLSRSSARRGARHRSADLPLFRPDISPVGADSASVMRCRRSLLVAGGCCRCCQPRSGIGCARQVTRRARPGPTRRPPAASDTSYPSSGGLTRRLCRAVPEILPVTARILQGMAPYPGQARCLALGFWPECFRRLNVKGGRRPFPEETRSALDIEGKHVTIQGPFPEAADPISRI
jgi:hypothetical protein